MKISSKTLVATVLALAGLGLSSSALAQEYNNVATYYVSNGTIFPATLTSVDQPSNGSITTTSGNVGSPIIKGNESSEQTITDNNDTGSFSTSGSITYTLHDKRGKELGSCTFKIEGQWSQDMDAKAAGTTEATDQLEAIISVTNNSNPNNIECIARNSDGMGPTALISTPY